MSVNSQVGEYKFNMKYISLYIISMIFFISCIKEKKDLNSFKPEELVVVSFDKLNNEQTYLQLIDSIRICPLGRNDNFFLSERSQLKVTSDLFLFLDRNILFVYDKTGNFKYRIECRGNGPEEYNNISNVFVIDTMIGIHDNFRKSVLLFSMKSGNFVCRKKIECGADEVIPLNDTLYVAFIKELANYEKMKIPYGIAIINNNGDIVRKDIPLTEWILTSSLKHAKNSVFACNDDEILFLPVLSNRIFSIGSDSVYCKYFIDYGDKNIPEAFLYENQKKMNSDFPNVVRQILNNEWILMTDYLQNSNDFIYFMSAPKSTLYYTLYDKKIKKAYTANFQKLPDPWSFVLKPYISSFQNTFYEYVSVSELKMFMKNRVKDIRLTQFQNQIEDLLSNGDYENEDFLLVMVSTSSKITKHQ